MKQSQLPKTDSIEQLADFWQTHDLTDFDAELEEVSTPVFVRGSAIKVQLRSRERKAVEQIARAKGVSREELIRTWIVEKLARGEAVPERDAGTEQRHGQESKSGNGGLLFPSR